MKRVCFKEYLRVAYANVTQPDENRRTGSPHDLSHYVADDNLFAAGNF
jgi:hypothetical protein